jgi:hypothetical protein
MNYRLLSAVLLTTVLAVPSLAATYVVRPDGTGDYATIQDAIGACGNGDIIELTDGTFRGPGNRAISYQGKAITVRSQSGDPRVCIIDCEHAAQGFSFTGGLGPASVLEGVTITNGQASSGGAMYFSAASPTIRECVFFNNSASTGGAIGS